MKAYKSILVLVSIFITLCALGQDNPAINPFKGKWINTQYEEFLKQKNDDNILYNISPQYIIIDSSGNCTTSLKYEQRSKFGKPIKSRTFGNITRLEYKKNYIIYLTEIAGNKDLILLSFYNNPCGMEMQGREYEVGSDYRYGFNGKEKENEQKVKVIRLIMISVHMIRELEGFIQ
jgi:hypothetical protein